jgi:predicted component of type VI protein secretion system
MATTFSLVILEGPNPGLRAELSKSSFVIGRDPACDLSVQDIEVSRRHARLIAQSGGYVIEDLGSTNGTFVNGQRVRTITPLQPGASIRLGELVTFSYEAQMGTDIDATPPSTQQLRAARAVRVEPFTQDPPARVVSPSKPTASLSQPISPARALAMDEPQEPLAEAPAAGRLRPRRKGLRLSIFSRGWMLGCGVLLLLGIMAGITFFWYVDANYLWCDVFGGLISACR